MQIFKSDFFKIFRSYAFYSILSSVVTFLSIPYLTRALTQEELGIIGIFQVILFVVVPLVSLQSTALVGINRVKLSRKKYDAFLSQYISLGFVLFLVCLLIGVLYGAYRPIWLMMAVIIPMIAFERFLKGVKQVELVQDERPTYFGRWNLAVSIGTLLVTVGLISGFDWGWEGRIGAVFLVEVIMLMAFLLIVDRSWHGLRWGVRKDFIIEIMKYGLPLLVAVGAGWVINQADRLIVLNYFTLADVGVYTAAYMIGYSINIINDTLVNSIAPKVFRALNVGGGWSLVRRYHIWYSIGIISLSLILATVGYFWVDVLLGDAYSEAGGVVAVVALAFGFSGAYRVPGLVIEFYKLNGLIVKLLYFCAFINIVLSLLLIPWLGILAPAFGTLLAYIVLSLLTYHYAMQAMRQRERGSLA